MPFEHPKALKFLLDVKELYQIPDNNVICLGDLWDLYWLSRYPKSPDAAMTANQEIEGVKKKIKEWAKAFPRLTITTGNHDLRVIRSALSAELPSVCVRQIEEILELPSGWEMHECVVPDVKKPFICLHGDGHGISSTTIRNNPGQFGGNSVAFGHWHSQASIMHVNTITHDAWSFNVGCLVDTEAFAFEYGKKSKFKPSIGCGVVMDEGRTPIWIPMPEDA